MQRTNKGVGINIFLSTLFLIIYLNPLYANDGSFEGTGATVFAIKDNRILMEKEEITIKFNRDFYTNPSKYRTKRWLADCTFTFINTKSEPVRVQMGFPDHYSHGDGPLPEWTISDFTTTIKNRFAEVTHKKVDTSKELLDIKKSLRLFYQGAYTWMVEFQPNERITVKNTYAFGGGSFNGPFIDLIKDKDSFVRIFREQLFWNGIRPGKQDWDYMNAGYEYASYIVTTGLTWAGPIGEADIKIELPPYTLPHLLIPSPRSYRIDNGFIHWTFKNWRPKQEIALYILRPYPPDVAPEKYPPLFDNLQQARAWLRIARKHNFDSYHINLLKNAYLAKYGHRFDDKRLQDFFDHQDWYEQSNKQKKIPLKDRRIMLLLERATNLK
jgi:hypothetical protein